MSQNKPVSTFTAFDTLAFQNSANTVYNYKIAYETINTGKTYQFKSDYERMQNLIGKQRFYSISSITNTH
jgi:hypothetical protein